MRLALPTRLRARAREGSGEQVPGQQAGEREHGVGHAVGAAADAEQLVEDDREDDHRDDGVQHGPQHAQHGLLVADEDVPPGEEVEQLAVLPQLAEPQLRPALRGLDHERRAVAALSALNVCRHCGPFPMPDGGLRVAARPAGQDMMRREATASRRGLLDWRRSRRTLRAALCKERHHGLVVGGVAGGTVSLSSSSTAAGRHSTSSRPTGSGSMHSCRLAPTPIPSRRIAPTTTSFSPTRSVPLSGRGGRRAHPRDRSPGGIDTIATSAHRCRCGACLSSRNSRWPTSSAPTSPFSAS